MILKIVFTFLLISIVNTAAAQKIIINGTEGNRPLQWSDFTGKPDDSNPYYALTYWNTRYKFSGVQFDGDKAIINGFEATLELDPKNSWLKKGKETDELLKHEQGHFDIGRLYLKEALKKMASASFTRANFQAELQRIFSETHKKYTDMGTQYDNETNHSINKDEQKKWNAFFSKELTE